MEFDTSFPDISISGLPDIPYSTPTFDQATDILSQSQAATAPTSDTSRIQDILAQ